MGHRGNDLLLSLSLPVHSYALHNSLKFSLGHIYTNMTFQLFTNVAPLGSLEHIYIYVPFIRGEVLTGVVKIFGHERKPEGGEKIGAVQRMHTRGDRKAHVGRGPTL